MEGLKQIPDKSINLIVIDPPYNIGKADWDKIDNYIEWMGQVFKECERVLKNNGSFYFFHNDFEQMAELQHWIKKNTSFIFKQMIVWDKFNGSKWNQLNAIVFSDDNRNYSKQAEYCLYYTKQEGSGLQDVLYLAMRDVQKYLNSYRLKKGLSMKYVNGYFGFSTKGAGISSHWFADKRQPGLPTKEIYDKLQLLLDIPMSFEEITQWAENKRKEYEKERYIFNNQNLPSVWQHEPIKQNGHITPKPIEILKNIILTSSNQNDIVLDCFIGSGSTAIACLETNRKYIGFENNKEYYNLCQDKINTYLNNK